MDLAHTLVGYNHLNFPHCECDARKAGHVIMSVGSRGIVLKACTEEGILQVGGTFKIIILKPPFNIIILMMINGCCYWVGVAHKQLILNG